MKNELDGLRNLNKWRIQFRKKKIFQKISDDQQAENYTSR
jgi:hypothetical protein